MPNIKPFYAVKSNPTDSLISLLKENKNIGFDVASITEINKTKDYLNTNGLIYSNPCKSDKEIEFAKKNNISLLVIDNISELEKINALYPKAEIIIRIKSTENFSSITFNSKFGCDYLEAQDMIKYIKKNNLNFKGFSYHVGSKCSNMIAHKLTLNDIMNIYTPLIKVYNLDLKIINIGGGFTDKNDLINFNELNGKIIEELKTKGIKVIAEPGRYFSQNYLSLIATIKSIRKMGDIYKLTINDSIYHTFNGIINDKQEYRPILIGNNRLNRNEIINCIIFGQTCDSGDIICKNINMQCPFVNDKLLFENIGAYSITNNFNGFFDADIKIFD